MLINNEFWEFKIITKKYFNLLWLATTLWIISIILSLTMYKTLWVVTTSLLSLLYLIFIYFFWYLILWEKPTRKDVFITIFVSICIFIGVMFKN
jgi:thiol:disulfide interchange protein